MTIDNSTTGNIRIDNSSNLFPFPFKFKADLLIDESHIVWEEKKKSINFKIKNQGTVTSEAFYITIKYKVAHKASKMLIRFWISELDAGKTITKSFDLMAYSNRYTNYLKDVEQLIIKIDDTNRVKESNEKNNIEVIEVAKEVEVDYHPGEVEKYTSSSARAKQWNIEWNEVNEDLDTKAYRNLIRAPYIQNVTTNSAVIVWRTISTMKQAYASVKLYNAGTGKILNSYFTNNHTFNVETIDATSNYVYDNNDWIKDNDQLNVKGSGQYRPNLEYRVTFKDLAPNTVYLYHIEAKGEDENKTLVTHTVANKIMFKTAPAQDSHEVVKFVAMGDFGQGDDRPSYYYDVFDLFHKVVRERGVDYWLALGDIDNCTDGHPNAIDPFFFSVYNAYMNEIPKKTSNLKFGQATTVKAFRNPPYYGILGGMPVYPTFGNHDIRYSAVNYDKVDKYSSWKQAYKSSFVFPSTQRDSWSSYAYRFNQEGEGFFYTYRYGNVISISLAVPGANNDYNHNVNQQIRKQNILLETYLKEIKSITDNDSIWLIVYAHDHHILDIDTYNYNVLFHKYNVNIVLSGHHHFYKERVSLNQNMLTGFSSNTKYDLVHFISGTGGYGDDDFSGASPTRRPGFISFEIKGNTLKYCKYDTHKCDSNGYPTGGRDGISPHIEEQGQLIQRGGKLIYSSCNSPVFEGEEYIPPRPITYTIKVETGDVVGAGTDAAVSIKLYGTNGESTFIQLDNKQDNFENSDKESFNIIHENIGNITKVTIKHDNSGDKAGWFLEKIIITQNNSIYNFTAQQWLSHSSRSIEPTITIKEDATRVKYNVAVRTSSSKYAGTDASVYIKLYGTNGKSTSLQRIDNKSINDFEKGSLGQYTVYADENLGEINKLKLEHDNTKDGAGWKISDIVINNQYTFHIDEWLESDNKKIHPNKTFTR